MDYASYDFDVYIDPVNGSDDRDERGVPDSLCFKTEAGLMAWIEEMREAGVTVNLNDHRVHSD